MLFQTVYANSQHSTANHFSHKVRGQRTEGLREVWGNVLMADQIHTTMTRVHVHCSVSSSWFPDTEILRRPSPKHLIHVRKYSIFHLYLANTEANPNTLFSTNKIPQKGTTGNENRRQTWIFQSIRFSHPCIY